MKVKKFLRGIMNWKIVVATLPIMVMITYLSFSATTPHTNRGWVSSHGHWYYYNTSGHLVKGWVKTGNKWYYMDNNGVMKSGWVYTGGKWYHMNPSGAMDTNWVLDGGNWYYLTSNGDMKTGWVQVNNKWYYLNGSGAMLKGWQTINGKSYYFNPGGNMASNTTVNGKRLGADGAVIIPPKPTVTGKKYPDGWVAPVLQSAWSPNIEKNYATLKNELGFTQGGTTYAIEGQADAISVIDDGPTSPNEVIMVFYGWVDPNLAQSYRVPIVTKELFKLYFGADANRVWNYFNTNDIPGQFTANGRTVTASYSEATGAISLQVGKK